MAELFNEEQQKVFNEELAKKQEQWRRKFDGFLSPEEVKSQTADLNKQISDLTKALEDSNKKIEGYTKDIADKDNAIKKYESHSVKTRIAHEAGLTYEAIDFLKGDDEDSIRKSAESLKTLMGTTVPPTPKNEPRIKKDDSNEAVRSLVKNLNHKE